MSVTTSSGLRTNLAGQLCYSLGWISGIFFLIVTKKNKYICFHAWQSIIFFGSITVLGIIFQLIPSANWYLDIVLAMLTVVFWRFLMYTAHHGEAYSLPLVGKLAKRLSYGKTVVSAAEIITDVEDHEALINKHNILSY